MPHWLLKPVEKQSAKTHLLIGAGFVMLGVIVRAFDPVIWVVPVLFGAVDILIGLALLLWARRTRNLDRAPR